MGRAFALALAHDGWFVRLHYHSSATEAEEVAKAIRGAGGCCDLVCGDLTTQTTHNAMFGPCEGGNFASLLVNSASIFEFDRPDSVTQDSLEQHFAVNAVAPILLSRRFAEQLPHDAHGLIVNLLDQKLAHLNPDFFAYTLSKSALDAATTMMAQAFAPRIRVNAIAPGITLPAPGQSEDEFHRAQSLSPLKVATDPSDIVTGLRFLIQARATTGQTIFIDGGQHLRGELRDVQYLARSD